MSSVSQATHLDTGHLQRMNRVRHALLKFVLDSGRPQEEHVSLDELCRLVQRITTSVDRGSCLVIDRRPLAVLGLWDVARRDAKRAQTVRGVVHEVQERLLRERLILAETLQDDRVRALAEQLDLSVWAPDYRGHALARRVELADVQDFVLE